MRKVFTSAVLLVLIVPPTYTIAQGKSDFGLSINGGLSYLQTNMNSTETEQTFYAMPSGHVGIYWNTYYWEKSFIGMGACIIEIQGREHSTTPQTDNFGNSTGIFNTTDSWRKISYWAMLFNYGRDFKKINVNLGMQFNIVYKMRGRDRTEIPYNGGTIINDTKSDALPIDSYDYVLRAGLIYNLTKKFSVEATYFYGLRDICLIDSWIWKVQQATIGLRYNLFSHGASSNEQ